MTATQTQTAKPRGRVKVETGAKRIRAFLGGVLVADTIRPAAGLGSALLPRLLLPGRRRADGPARGRRQARPFPSRGDGHTFTVRAGSREAPRAALRYEDSPLEELRDTIRLDWDAMDAWFEEDEEVFTHPRDPYTRVDILPSSRHVRIEVDGVTVAESTSPRLLFETGLPARYYLPKTHVRMDLLERNRHGQPLPLQGRRRVVVGADRRRGPRGPRLVLSDLRCPRARRSPA